ncbi:MAG: RnfABCDGE type electron transport complex subunit D [Candidatus Aureabacteria bacterium]|nr:RnfABCDGE type electron transport complex subunit D [Candidatus Auribacterota bacterium]
MSADDQRLFILSPGPHLSSDESVERIMWRVTIALLPALGWGIWSFGLAALRVTAACVVSCVVVEAIVQRLLRKQVTVSDGSAVVTGLLLAFNLPPGVPLWMPAVGSGVAIAIAKHAFGGLGYNIFNPALIGRAFLMASYPVQMTTWRPYGAWDNVTGATPLGIVKEKLAIQLPSYMDMFLGRIGGCIGETSTLLLLLGAAFLLVKSDITWHTPVSFLGALALMSWLSGRDPLFAILAGGAVLGACFMATDMVTVPISGRGRLIFGGGCGVITGVIRAWGGYPEGVCYAILLMNAFTPVIDRYTPPRRFGSRAKRS